MKRIAMVTVLLASMSGVTYAAGNCGGGAEAHKSENTSTASTAQDGDKRDLRSKDAVEQDS